MLVEGLKSVVILRILFCLSTQMKPIEYFSRLSTGDCQFKDVDDKPKTRVKSSKFAPPNKNFKICCFTCGNMRNL